MAEENSPVTAVPSAFDQAVSTSREITGTPQAPTAPTESRPAEESRQPADAPTAPPEGQQEDSFFDSQQVTPDLNDRYKAMQAAYTRKTQEIAAQRRKIEAYDEFMSNPIQALQQTAAQFGLTLSRAQAAEAIQQQQAQQQPGEPWVPQSYEEIVERAETNAEQRVMQRFAPIFQEMQKIKASGIEQKLTEIDKDWRIYEDDMRQLLREHPSLARTPEKLYKLAVPDEVQAAKVAQQVMKKLKGQTEAAGVSKTGLASKTASAPRKVTSFSDAVEEAKARLAQR